MLPLSTAENASRNGSKKCCFCLLKDGQRKSKMSMPVSREGSIQMDTLDTLEKQSQAADYWGKDVRMADSIFLAEEMVCQNYYCGEHNPLTTNSLTKEELVIC